MKGQKAKGLSSRVRGRQGGEDVCVKADLLCEFVRSWTVWDDDTFPLCLHSTTKRHLCPVPTLDPFHSFLWQFTSTAPCSGPPERIGLFTDIYVAKHASHTHAMQPSASGLGEAVHFWKKTFSGEHLTAKTTLNLVSNLLQNPCPVKDASFLSKILFWWFTG